MNSYDVSFKKNKVDYLLSITAMLQPVLALTQFFLLDAMHMEPGMANQVRVMSTAIPILLAMIFVVVRKPMLTYTTYSLVFFILMMTVLAYPGRWVYMSDDVLKFTLPVVIPVGLCVASVRNLAVLIRCMMVVSISAALIGILYAATYMSGLFVIEGYNMGFSYALLLPAFILITKQHWVWKVIATVLMIEMLAIGSRGALLITTLYWGFILIRTNRSFRRVVLYLIPVLIVIILFFDTFINSLSTLFDAIGINSRTLHLFNQNELLTHDSGREEISKIVWNYINQNPVFGCGVWADRQIMDSYCHNILLELLLDFGYVGAFVILLIFLYKQINIFIKIPSNHKTMYIMMLGLVLPLFASSSYLTSFNMGMFLGFSYLLSKLYKEKKYQDFQYR